MSSEAVKVTAEDRQTAAAILDKVESHRSLHGATSGCAGWLAYDLAVARLAGWRAGVEAAAKECHEQSVEAAYRTERGECSR